MYKLCQAKLDRISIYQIDNIRNCGATVAFGPRMHRPKEPLVPRPATVNLTIGGRQQVAMGGRTQQRAAKPQSQHLSAVIERRDVQSFQGVLVRLILVPQHHAQRSSLEPLNSCMVELSES